MIKKIPDNFWFPFWVDKWIFGSIRLEFEPEERAVWIDLLALAAKDNGYIRANEETPYLMKQLAGLLVYEEDFFERTVKKFIEKGKLKIDHNEILYVTNWDKYKFSSGYKRVLKHRKKKEESESVTPSVINDTKKITHNITNHNKSNHNKSNKEKGDEIESEFEEFWKFYRSIGNPQDDSGDKQEALKAYKILRRIEPKEKIARATHGYGDHFKAELDQGFKKRKMYASTFLRSKKWERFVEFQYKARL